MTAPQKPAPLLIINDMLFGGGRERRIVQLIAGLNRMGVRNIILVLLDERIDYPEVLNLDVKIIKIKRRHNRDLIVFWKLYLICRMYKPSVVNPWSYMSTLYAAPLCRLLGIRCVGAFVVDAKRPRRLSLNWLAMKIGFKLCERVIGNSAAGHTTYRTPLNKRQVIYNGYDASRIGRVKPMPHHQGVIVIAMIARLDRQKDFHTFIDAIALVVARGISLRAYVVGDGEDMAALRAYADVKCRDVVTFTGFSADVDAIISMVDIGVLCTNPKYHAEGISNALMEVMAQSKPVVATDGGGTPELIYSGESGFLVPAYDANALADRLFDLCVDVGLRQRIGEAAAQTIATKFSLERMASEFKKALHNAE